MKNIILVIITLLIVGCGIEKDNKMDIIDFRDLTYDATNLLDDATPLWSVGNRYDSNTVVRYGNKLYKSRKMIGTMCDVLYSHNTDTGSETVKVLDESLIIDLAYYGDTFETGVTSQTDFLSYTVHSFGSSEIMSIGIDEENPDSNAIVVYTSRTNYIPNTTPLVVCNLDNGKFYIALSTGNYNFSENGFSSSPLQYSYANSSGASASLNFNTWDEVVGYRSSVYTPDTSPLEWEDIGYTNKYKALDTSLSSQTINNGIITMEFIEPKVDSIFFLNVYAQSIRVQVLDIDNGNLSVYDTLKDNWDLNATDWYDYFFNEPTTYNKINFDVPIVFNAKILITINPIVDGTTLAKVGLVGMGRRQEIGGVLYGSSTKIIDYSTKQVNGSGETYLEVGDYKVSNNIQIDIDTGTFDFVNDLLASLRAKPVMFNGSDKFKTFQVFGVFKDYTTLLSGVSKSRLNLQIESMI